MNTAASFYQQRFALIDLAAGTTKALPLQDTPLALGKAYPDAIIFATGPYTGSFAPASGRVTISIPAGDRYTHSTLPLGRGAWLKRSGFDALVIVGKSSGACIIRCEKGICSLEDAKTLQGFEKDHFGLAGGRNALRKELLRRTPDGLAGLILADVHFADVNTLCAACGSEYGSLPGGPMLAGALQAINVLAVSLNGGCDLPPIPIPLVNALRQEATVNTRNQDALINELAMAMGTEQTLPPLPALRRAACYHCPSPCLAWVAPDNKPWLLVADHTAFAFALEHFGNHAPTYLAVCDSYGLDPLSAYPHFADGKIQLPAYCVPKASPQDHVTTHAPADCSAQMRLGLILGICPRLIRRTPSLDRKKLSALLPEELLAQLLDADNLLTVDNLHMQEVFL